MGFKISHYGGWGLFPYDGPFGDKDVPIDVSDDDVCP